MSRPVEFGALHGVLLFGFLLGGGCHGIAGRSAGDGQVPLFEGMGNHRRAVTTSSRPAQRYFDQGLTWTFAFNHDEAIRSFTEAARQDPNCAMAWWGVALCHGPHINNPVVPVERAQAAWEALQKARSLRERASPVEQALIEALSKRYANQQPEDRRRLDEAYAEAMGEAWRQFPQDADVGVLYAESLMDLRPWDLWTREGRPQPGTEEILKVLERALALNLDHPGANHLYIHAVEASPRPDRGDAAANRLRNAVPASGHLTHMPSHIDVLTGRWALASRQNERAMKIDRQYRARSPRQGFYRVYMTHNAHMLAFASMMEGRSGAAMRAARAVVDDVPEDYKQREAALVDPFMGAPYDVMKRFGRWDEILAEPAPPSYLPITTAMWRFHRGLAYAAKGDLGAAERERTAFREAVGLVPEGAVLAINSAHDILKIAEHMLNGELAFRGRAIDESISELRKGVELEDRLKYMEPPEWVQPVRHTLGAVLVHAGRYEEAEQVYREDLGKWPENGWSLQGLSAALVGQGKGDEQSAVRKRFERAWSRADLKIESSCLCVPGGRG